MGHAGVDHHALPVVSQFSIALDSRCLSLVEVEEASEPLPSFDTADRGDRIGGREGDDVAEALVVAFGVVVLHELAHDGAQVLFAEGGRCAGGTRA